VLQSAGSPLDADRFISQVQDEMREALDTLNRGLKKIPDVCIGPKGGGPHRRLNFRRT